ncbi:MAG: type II toxin-antitoxin system VapC family toxin [Longimicrobiales bacterium]|nr:type II toxin-antitoxin system VapC family toxin [Longimicrobiales bacterium]
MIVVDASAVLEFLLDTPTGARVGRLLDTAGPAHAPALLDVEVAQVLRRLVHSGSLDEEHGRALLEILQDTPIDRHRIDPLLPRIWQLRHNLTAYDAAYVALAEALECPVVTLDERIAGAPGVCTEVRAP